jgi:hypothetical protein
VYRNIDKHRAVRQDDKNRNARAANEWTFRLTKGVPDLGNEPSAMGGRSVVRETVPQFAPVHESRYQAFCEALEVFWEVEPSAAGLGLVPGQAWPKEHLPVPGLFCSALLHFSLTFFLLQVPFALFRLGNPKSLSAESAPRKVYDLKVLKLADYFPVLQASGPGGRPGKGSRLNEPPARGSTVRNPRIRIISNPPFPDNTRQTIIQPTTPPTLKIPDEITLPNVILGLNVAAPDHPAEKRTEPQAPVIPKVQAPTTGASDIVPARPPDLALPVSPIPNVLAALPVPVPPASALSPASPKAPESRRITDLPAATARQDTRQLIALGVDPAPPSDAISLSPGRRFGSFSVSAAGGGPGSPGGTVGGTGKGGAGGSGDSGGGEGSTGLGSGGQGGGGGTSTTGLTISSTTDAEVKRGESGLIVPSPAAALVYAVTTPIRPVHNGIVVTAGPAGGGGLRIYGVLRGGKIYTTYLPMPGKSWILQYSAHETDPHDSQGAAQSVEIRLAPPLVPPSAEEQFDFHRPPLAKSKTGDMIVLKGLIRQDGSVDRLSVLQGLDDTADEAALIAFGRWKFRPAMRAGKPLEVEILVGIPALTSVR